MNITMDDTFVGCTVVDSERVANALERYNSDKQIAETTHRDRLQQMYRDHKLSIMDKLFRRTNQEAFHRAYNIDWARPSYVITCKAGHIGHRQFCILIGVWDDQYRQLSQLVKSNAVIYVTPAQMEFIAKFE